MKTHILRALTVVSVLIAAVLIFAGCTNDPKEVKHITEDQAKEYVSKNLPAAKYESKKTLDDGIEYTFTDELCGFKFTVNSMTEKKYMDATVIGYSEKTSDNWDSAYYDYLKEKLSAKTDAAAKDNGFKLTWGGRKYLLYIGTEKSFDELKPILEDLGAAFKAEDKHGKLSESEIWCFTGETVDYNKLTAAYLFAKNGVVDKAGYDEYRGKGESVSSNK